MADSTFQRVNIKVVFTNDRALLIPLAGAIVITNLWSVRSLYSLIEPDFDDPFCFQGDGTR